MYKMKKHLNTIKFSFINLFFEAAVSAVYASWQGCFYIFCTILCILFSCSLCMCKEQKVGEKGSETIYFNTNL